MTAQQLIELTLHQSPLDDAAIAELYLNKALRDFCEETLILRRRATIEVPQAGGKRFALTEPSDIIRIRELSYEGTELVNTALPEYLVAGNGYWYMESNEEAKPGLFLAQWTGNASVPFEPGDILDIVYEAYARPVARDEAGAEDYGAAPEIPERFHDALVSRACEKANFGNPDMRSYWHALWRDEVIKGKRHAKEMMTNATWNVKLYTL